MKNLTDKIATRAYNEIVMLLLASRDSYVTQERHVYHFDSHDPYYCEAFGVLRGIHLMGYGYWGANNHPAERDNLKWFFDYICKAALNIEEGMGLKPALDKYRKLADKHQVHR